MRVKKSCFAKLKILPIYAPICVILATFATEFELRFILTAARNVPH
ncbi:hypothetical protein CAMGR0001_2474 [Campylobacter gracilis RM3268]|uniref:Uncharacterized protein n=1 Tax=Campylobacter gracilis RM3268 TaxID=553220 RepID=C8PFC1_9BACT|nr:hypothetical protein CAMGR0001_2474 [Campylobacter gracilis RM3268]